MSHAATPIVLLEDDRVLRSLIADGLQAARYAVVQAATAPAALAAIEAAAGRAILVADRQIASSAGPNGFQLAAQALEQHAALRVVYVSGNHIAVRRRVLGERERALLKPFAMSQLLTMVRELGG